MLLTFFECLLPFWLSYLFLIAIFRAPVFRSTILIGILLQYGPIFAFQSASRWTSTRNAKQQRNPHPSRLNPNRGGFLTCVLASSQPWYCSRVGGAAPCGELCVGGTDRGENGDQGLQQWRKTPRLAERGMGGGSGCESGGRSNSVRFSSLG